MKFHKFKLTDIKSYLGTNLVQIKKLNNKPIELLRLEIANTLRCTVNNIIFCEVYEDRIIYTINYEMSISISNNTNVEIYGFNINECINKDIYILITPSLLELTNKELELWIIKNTINKEHLSQDFISSIKRHRRINISKQILRSSIETDKNILDRYKIEVDNDVYDYIEWNGYVKSQTYTKLYHNCNLTFYLSENLDLNLTWNNINTSYMFPYIVNKNGDVKIFNELMNCKSQFEKTVYNNLEDCIQVIYIHKYKRTYYLSKSKNNMMIKNNLNSVKLFEESNTMIKYRTIQIYKNKIISKNIEYIENADTVREFVEKTLNVKIKYENMNNISHAYILNYPIDIAIMNTMICTNPIISTLIEYDESTIPLSISNIPLIKVNVAKSTFWMNITTTSDNNLISHLGRDIEFVNRFVIDITKLKHSEDISFIDSFINYLLDTYQQYHNYYIKFFTSVLGECKIIKSSRMTNATNCSSSAHFNLMRQGKRMHHLKLINDEEYDYLQQTWPPEKVRNHLYSDEFGKYMFTGTDQDIKLQKRISSKTGSKSFIQPCKTVYNTVKIEGKTIIWNHVSNPGTIYKYSDTTIPNILGISSFEKSAITVTSAGYDNNAFIRGVMMATGYIHITDDTINNIRSMDVLDIVTCKQDNPYLTESEINENLKDLSRPFSPSRFYRMLEEYFNINIYILELTKSKDSKINLILSKGKVWCHDNNRKSIIILLNGKIEYTELLNDQHQVCYISINGTSTFSDIAFGIKKLKQIKESIYTNVNPQVSMMPNYQVINKEGICILHGYEYEKFILWIYVIMPKRRGYKTVKEEYVKLPSIEDIMTINNLTINSKESRVYNSVSYIYNLNTNLGIIPISLYKDNSHLSLKHVLTIETQVKSDVSDYKEKINQQLADLNIDNNIKVALKVTAGNNDNNSKQSVILKHSLL